MDFKQLKKQSSLGSLTEKLLKEAEKMGSASSMKDERIFTVERDKSGLGFAVIRFMPPPPGEEDAFVRLYNHGFQANGRWLIENCPTTLKEQCPICASNGVLYNSGIDSNKKIASQRKRKLSFYSNVYIVKNPANPELEGTVMLFRFGQKIFDKITSAMKPAFQDESPVDPFDMWSGANFKIKVKTVKEASGQSYPNYDDSIFESPSALLDGDDEELEAIWKTCHSLKDLVSPDKFKSEEELQKRLDAVLGAKPPQSTSHQEEEKEMEEQFDTNNTDIMKELEQSYSRSKVVDDDDDDDYSDALDKFRELAS